MLWPLKDRLITGQSLLDRLALDMDSLHYESDVHFHTENTIRLFAECAYLIQMRLNLDDFLQEYVIYICPLHFEY
jgi:hypothetical protein